MTTVSAVDSMPYRQRALAMSGTVAAIAICVAAVLISARFIGVTPPSDDISPYCQGPYHCVRPYANPLAPNRFDPLVSSRSGIGGAELAPMPVSPRTPASRDAGLSGRKPDFQPTS
jgi:hypothetical protein